MMAGNLSIEQRKWIFKQYWKTENAERVRTAWVEAFNTPPPTRVVKNKVYERKPQTVDEMREFITDAFMDIDSDRKLCRTVCQGVSDRLDACCNVDGGHFEH
jgi:hypothetical protein